MSCPDAFRCDCGCMDHHYEFQDSFIIGLKKVQEFWECIHCGYEKVVIKNHDSNCDE